MDMFTRSLALSFIPSGWSLIQKHSIEEVIWGYTDPVLERLKTFGQTDQTVFGFFMNDIIVRKDNDVMENHNCPHDKNAVRNEGDLHVIII